MRISTTSALKDTSMDRTEYSMSILCMVILDSLCSAQVRYFNPFSLVLRVLDSNRVRIEDKIYICAQFAADRTLVSSRRVLFYIILHCVL